MPRDLMSSFESPQGQPELPSHSSWELAPSPSIFKKELEALKGNADDELENHLCAFLEKHREQGVYMGLNVRVSDYNLLNDLISKGMIQGKQICPLTSSLSEAKWVERGKELVGLYFRGNANSERVAGYIKAESKNLRDHTIPADERFLHAVAEIMAHHAAGVRYAPWKKYKEPYRPGHTKNP